jgi:hypothetical protein
LVSGEPTFFLGLALDRAFFLNPVLLLDPVFFLDVVLLSALRIPALVLVKYV